MKIVFHYTYDHFAEILASGVLLPPAMVPTLREEPLPLRLSHLRGNADYVADASLLLFSSNPVWERGSYRGVVIDGDSRDLLQLEDYDRIGMAVHRIGVDASILKPWIHLKRAVQMPGRMGRRLEEIARGLGSDPAREWWGTTVPVPSAQWLSIETRVNGVWQAMKIAA